jgi:3-phosphoshikimate 1-carboxyvinyltransferase
MDILLHSPLKIKNVEITLTGSKSISNRVLIIKALSGLPFEIQNLSNSDDTLHLQEALEQYKTSSFIDVGHAGTDMRFLTAYLGMKNGCYELTGSERLQQRPIKDLVDVLQLFGADISYKTNVGYPPLIIKGKKLDGGCVEINGNVSSQFITAILLVAPYFTNGLELTIKNELVSKPYVNMTIELMKEFGAEVVWEENKIFVKPIPYHYSKEEFVVESDWSAASYYYSIVALAATNTTLTLNNFFSKSLQADAICSTIYKKFGVNTVFLNHQITITKIQTHDVKSYFEYNFMNCPDIAQTVLVTCVGLNLPCKLKGLQTLKIKETDRILALQNETAKFGCDLKVTESSIKYDAEQLPFYLKHISIATYHDHRMAMSFAPLCLLYKNINILQAEVVTKSYPLFWDDLIKIGIKNTKQ